jgi:hypothetical protein
MFSLLISSPGSSTTNQYKYPDTEAIKMKLNIVRKRNSFLSMIPENYVSKRHKKRHIEQL